MSVREPSDRSTRKLWHPLDDWYGLSPLEAAAQGVDAVSALQPERDALWARLEAASFLTEEERRRMAGLGA